MNGWDAPSAADAAIRAAGQSRHILAAEFALRLARLGHVREVSVTVAGGPDAAEAVRSVLAELAAQDASEPEAETAQQGTVAAQGEEPAPDAPETLPDAKATFPKNGSSPAQDAVSAVLAVLAVLASGPSSSRDLAAQLHRRSGTILAALHGLEQAGLVVRSQRTGRGARWVLGPHGRP